MKKSQQRDILLEFNDRDYHAKIVTDATRSIRTKMNWGEELAVSFNQYADIPDVVLQFEKSEFIRSNSSTYSYLSIMSV